MFGLRHYTILLNEVFDTGYNSDDLLARLQAFLAAEKEPVRSLREASSELYVILNNNRVMHAFTRIMGGEVRLNSCFRRQVTRLQRVDFILLTTPDGCCLGIRFDGVVACAVSETGSGVGVPSSAQTRH
ncbi:hypothetical protein [Pantoea agglomerans]|jgi:hypothetical protein|uniref:Uncharacterized protein n=1 Tax=Enterobacter agglomerans TaxID=549 RepID=A0AAN2FID6_ENTAG|nr:hypothetical protein [Pantoea agglomerans]CAH6377073.1 hypothetical protein DAPPPG734_24285 [Pantoea agglomerans]